MCWPEGLAIWNSAVIVSVEQPHTSARNNWPAIVVGLTLLTDRVRIDLEGEPAAIVDVTPTAVSELELTSGSRNALFVRFGLGDVGRGDGQAGEGNPGQRGVGDAPPGVLEGVLDRDRPLHGLWVASHVTRRPDPRVGGAHIGVDDDLAAE